MRKIKIFVLKFLVFAGFTSFKEQLIILQMDAIKANLRKARTLLKELENIKK